MTRAISLITFTLLSLTLLAQSKASTLIDNIADRFTFSGYAQLGWEYHENEDPSNDFKLNKLIIMSNMRITDRWNAFAMFDFKGFTLQELWMNYKVQPWLNIKVGQFKTPFTIENPLSPSILETVNQTSLATNYFVLGGSDLMMPAGAGRDIGITLYGNAGDYVSYDLAVMNGSGRGKRDDNSWKDVVGRLTLHPVKCLDVSGSFIIGKGATRTLGEASLTQVWGQNEIKDDYKRNRFAVGAYLKTTPADLRAEWMWGKDGEHDANGGYVTGLVKNVGTKNLDIVASFDHLDTGLSTNRYQAGVQYWFYRKCRIQAGYCYTKVKGQDGLNGILTQIQVGF